ncbi:hypothetical protein PV396_04700 [Streptomyces sp. ME02-8801-2C]|uniref:hypothetical protein n=1 Tax=Streptomyces sp. ME02-8801-2C TaxID=3028680 RepID=UPI0029BC07EC|nr:hypothetical protein [Streptomyces sp. ME02-8801-2C]MDX3451253.1 hypothetical protein [Streptomyces sp. ME02-8801-2C]
MSGYSEREQEVLEGLDLLIVRLDREHEQGLSLLDTHAVLRVWSGTPYDALHDLAVPLGLGAGGRVVAVGRTVVVGDHTRSHRITHDFDSQVGRERVPGQAVRGRNGLDRCVRREDVLSDMLEAPSRDRGSRDGASARRLLRVRR